jgi:PEGA domain
VSGPSRQRRFTGGGRFLGVCAAWIVLTSAAPCFAQNKAAADVLFQSAREAMARSDYDEACLKFDESNRADPAVGTVLNLGNCEELRGRFASSWERYTEAMGMMDPSDRRYAFAKKKAEQLESQIPRLVVDLAEGSPPDTTVELNGEPLPGQPGTSMRVNPGAYTVTVRAPGFEPGSYSVQLDVAETQRISVATGDVIPVVERPRAPPPPPVIVEVQDKSSRQTLKIITGVASLVGLAAGGTLGALAYDKWGTVQKKCKFNTSSDKIQCQDGGATAGTTGQIFGFTAMGAGALGLISGGLFLYFVLDEPASPRASVAVGTVAGSPGVTFSSAF